MTQQCLKCGAGNIDDFHGAFTMGLCMSCYMNEKASITQVRPRTRAHIKYAVDVLSVCLLALACIFLATGIIAIGMWRWF